MLWLWRFNLKRKQSWLLSTPSCKSYMFYISLWIQRQLPAALYFVTDNLVLRKVESWDDENNNLKPESECRLPSVTERLRPYKGTASGKSVQRPRYRQHGRVWQRDLPSASCPAVSVKLATRLCLVPRLRKRGAIPQLPLQFLIAYSLFNYAVSNSRV